MDNEQNNQALVQIRSAKEKANASDQADSGQAVGDDSGISRRKFLKILGTTSVAGAVGCSDDTSHKALPFVVGQDQNVPGVSTWFRSTCQECSAGCGVTVRTREGARLRLKGILKAQ